jgi:hypothetical protein
MMDLATCLESWSFSMASLSVSSETTGTASSVFSRVLLISKKPILLFKKASTAISLAAFNVPAALCPICSAI